MKRRLSLETLEDRLLLATLAVHGTDEADVFEFSPGRISVNGVEQLYDTSENPQVLIDGLSGESTRSVALEGSLQRTGDVATTAQRIQTGVLGTNFYSAPTTRANTQLAAAPPVIASATGGTSGGGGAIAAGTFAPAPPQQCSDTGLAAAPLHGTQETATGPRPVGSLLDGFSVGVAVVTRIRQHVSRLAG